MRVLVACEFSGVVRRAFRALGHDAWSCDFLPAEDGSEHHFQGSVVSHDIVKRGWDLMIAHPECTYLTVSANRWASEEWRMEARHWALAMVRTLWAFPVPRIAIENPIGVLPTIWKKATQCIQPWQYGHFETKATCLWLKNLPPLQPTNVVWDGNEENKPEEKVWKMPPSENRWKERSRTYEGIAAAMAEQWGNLLADSPAPVAECLG